MIAYLKKRMRYWRLLRKAEQIAADGGYRISGPAYEQMRRDARAEAGLPHG